MSLIGPTETLEMLLAVGAVNATVVVTSGTVVGIFQEPYAQVSLLDGSPVGVDQPSFLTRTMDVANLSRGSELVIDSRTWKVKEKQRLDDGVLSLLTLGAV